MLQIHLFTYISQIVVVVFLRMLVWCLKIVEAVSCVFRSFRNNVDDSAYDPNIKNNTRFCCCFHLPPLRLATFSL